MKRITFVGMLFLSAAITTSCGGAAEEVPSTSTPAEPPAQAAPGRGLATATIGGHQISVDYGRPQLQGRDMLNQLPEGQTWRFGMNAATQLTTATDLQFGETTVAAGSYSLFLKKASADTWHLIFNRQTGQWGTDYDPAQDAYEIPFTVGPSDEKVEVFTIVLEGGESAGRLIATWDTLNLTADFSLAG